MDFGRTTVSGLLNNVSLEKAKYSTVLFKLKTLLNINKDYKLIINSVDKLLLSQDPIEIYDNVNFPHPLLKILKEYLVKIDDCAGGPLYFVEICKSLIEKIQYLLENGKKPKNISDTLKDLSSILSSFDICVTRKESFYIDENVEALIKVFVSDKHLSELLINAIKTTQSYSPEKIRICKVYTGSNEDSYSIDGFVLNREPEGKIKEHTNTSIGIFNSALDINRTELKGTILFNNADQLLNFTKDETKRIKELIDSLNVNIVVVSGTINEMFLEFLDSRKIMVLRVFNKYDLKRICDTVGGTIHSSIGPISRKGFVKRVETYSDGGNTFTKIINGSLVTIVLKNSVKEIIDEKERRILSLLKCLERRSIFDLSNKDDTVKILGILGTDSAIKEHITEAISNMNEKIMFKDDKVRCLRLAFEFLGLLLEIDDYLVAKRDQLDVKAPQHKGHWDDEN